MKRVITHPQTSDMGSGFGKLEIEPNTSLKQVCNYIKSNFHTWGVCTIQCSDGKILRKFDYDLYNNDIFYYHFGREAYLIVKEVKLEFCFMYENITIIVDK